MTKEVSSCKENTQTSPHLIKLEGINFQVPWCDYQYTLEETPFTSFDEYANHIENNLIKEQIQSNQQNQLTESELNLELEKFEGRYSFEHKEVNGFNVLVHRRDFFGLIGDIYEVHVYLENGKVLILYEELYHERLDKILSTINK